MGRPTAVLWAVSHGQIFSMVAIVQYAHVITQWLKQSIGSGHARLFKEGVYCTWVWRGCTVHGRGGGVLYMGVEGVAVGDSVRCACPMSLRFGYCTRSEHIQLGQLRTGHLPNSTFLHHWE